MKLLARGKWGRGWKRIDEIGEDDEVLSRDENDPNGPPHWKRVEETVPPLRPHRPCARRRRTDPHHGRAPVLRIH